MSKAWHNLSERLEALLEEQQNRIKELEEENAQLKDELNALKPVYSPEVEEHEAQEE